jgi:hypothetical protein
MIMAELADEDLMSLKPVAENQMNKEWKNIGWFTNDKGYKEYGIIPTKYNYRR